MTQYIIINDRNEILNMNLEMVPGEEGAEIAVTDLISDAQVSIAMIYGLIEAGPGREKLRERFGELTTKEVETNSDGTACYL